MCGWLRGKSQPRANRSGGPVGGRIAEVVYKPFASAITPYLLAFTLVN
jgi:hypothetical protein